MADVHPLPEICCLKNSDILVHVEEALFDFLVVSYEYDSKLYQGVLLDASKRALPCGILAPAAHPETEASQHGLGTDEDKMHSVAQRHSYFQGKSPPHSSSPSKEGFSPGSAYHMRRTMRGGQSKLKSSRMTVRLRPRQVLCSKCKSICNENSENVDLSRKRKGEESSSSANGPVEKRNYPSRQISPKSPRPPFSENPQDNKTSNSSVSRRKNSGSPAVDTPSLRPSLIPKTVKESEVPSSLNSNVNKIKLVGTFWTTQPDDDKVEAESSRSTSSSQSKANGRSEAESVAVTEEDLSKSANHNHSIEISEAQDSSFKSNLYEGTDVGKSSPNYDDLYDNHGDSSSKLNSSFASTETDESQDRMVLRKKRNVGSMEDLWDESVFLEDTTRRTTPVIKISFGTQGEGTVLKIPAKVRSYHDSESDLEDPEGTQLETPAKDARTKATKKALKKAKKEARRKVPSGSSGSPSRLLDNSSPAYETSLYHRRRKRKVKHKKKHRGVDGQQKIIADEEELNIDIPPLLVEAEDPLKIDDNTSSEPLTASNPCDYDLMKEKCLKQKLSISLKRLNATAYARCGNTSSSVGSDSPSSTSELSGADELPDFPRPPSDNALTSVSSCLTNDGRTMEVGDVVWGKIRGFPWWPGKVLSITVQRKDDGAAEVPQAYVAWYGSSTCSLMPCDQLSPFLETFKSRYNKKKRGPYKEAIRQATCEARKDSLDPLQEIDVVS